MMTLGHTSRVQCRNCLKDMELAVNESLRSGNLVTQCAVCGHDAFYVQKDFNRNVGLGIVVLGAAASLYFFYQSEPLYAMSALAATALVDFVVHRVAGDVTVCYSCHALYRGFKRNPEHENFDLKKLEKYGGRTPRQIP